MARFKTKKEPETPDIEGEIRRAMEQIETIYTTFYDASRILNLNEQAFTFCLGAISAARRFPGIDKHMGFEKMYHCDQPADLELVRFHLQKQFHIHDFESLVQCGNQFFSSGKDYQIFYGFWNNQPPFAIDQLTPEDRQVFTACKDFARYFYPYLKESGMYAWDYNERIGLLRLAYACDLITLAQYKTLASEIAKKALEKYHNWQEYAMACVAGGALFMFKNTQSTTDALAFMQRCLTMTIHIMKEDRVWLDAAWGYQPERHA